MRKSLIFLFLILWFSSVNTVFAETPLKKVSLIPQWIPQASFAGYIVALEKGFYLEAGIDLTLHEGGPDKSSFAQVSAGKATFCSGWLAYAIAQRVSGLRVVNLAQIIQRSALMLVARKSSGIKIPKDFNGKTVGLWEGQWRVQPRILFHKFGVKVRIVPAYTSMNLFLKGGVDAITAMWYNEYHKILNSGLNPDELSLFFFSDFGLNMPEDGLYCMEETFKADPQLCARFVQASLKGWLYAFNHEDETVELVMKHADAAHTGTNRAHQRWMLAHMKDLIMPGGDKNRLGKLRPDDYTHAGQLLKESGMIDRLPRFDGFYVGSQ